MTFKNLEGLRKPHYLLKAIREEDTAWEAYYRAVEDYLLRITVLRCM